MALGLARAAANGGVAGTSAERRLSDGIASMVSMLQVSRLKLSSRPPSNSSRPVAFAADSTNRTLRNSSSSENCSDQDSSTVTLKMSSGSNQIGQTQGAASEASSVKNSTSAIVADSTNQSPSSSSGNNGDGASHTTTPVSSAAVSGSSPVACFSAAVSGSSPVACFSAATKKGLPIGKPKVPYTLPAQTPASVAAIRHASADWPTLDESIKSPPVSAPVPLQTGTLYSQVGQLPVETLNINSDSHCAKPSSFGENNRLSDHESKSDTTIKEGGKTNTAYVTTDRQVMLNKKANSVDGGGKTSTAGNSMGASVSEDDGPASSNEGQGSSKSKKKGNKKNWKPLEIPVPPSRQASERRGGGNGGKKHREGEMDSRPRRRETANGDYHPSSSGGHAYSSEGEGGSSSRGGHSTRGTGNGSGNSGERRWTSDSRRPIGRGVRGASRGRGSGPWRGARRGDGHSDTLNSSGRVTPSGGMYDDYPGEINYYVDFAPIVDPAITPKKASLLSPGAAVPINAQAFALTTVTMSGEVPLTETILVATPNSPGASPVLVGAPIPVAGAVFAPPFYSPSPAFAPLPATTYDPVVLQKAIRKQIEYYFSDENLQRDIFIRRKMDSGGYLPISLIASFHRVQNLTHDVAMVIEALKTSTAVELSDDQIKARTRKNPLDWPIRVDAASTLDATMTPLANSQTTTVRSPSNSAVSNSDDSSMRTQTDVSSADHYSLMPGDTIDKTSSSIAANAMPADLNKTTSTTSSLA